MTDLILQAPQSADLEIIQLIYHSGIKNINDYINVDSRNLGHYAVAAHNLDIIHFLKYHVHFDFSAKDRWMHTPLDDANKIQHKLKQNDPKIQIIQTIIQALQSVVD